MQALNPFIRAFFKSTLQAQCNPVHNHILLVPTTEVLLKSRDRESDALYADLASSEDFLASHVIRITPTQASANSNVRDNRGKARQFSTINGRTVVVKESFVYSNKGFKNLNQAQLLSDVIFYPDQFDAQQWLIYYISRPLIGSFEPVTVTPASLPAVATGLGRGHEPPEDKGKENVQLSLGVQKRPVQSFDDLLNQFPMIARQMQPGLEHLFKEFHKELADHVPIRLQTPKLVRRSSTTSSLSGSNGSIHSRYSGSNGSIRSRQSDSHRKSLLATSRRDEETQHVRQVLETAVTAAIDLFQLVDKQQLSLLGSTTELTGPAVERLIERYVTEQLHDSTLFPMICNSRKLEDLELESDIHGMEYVDIAQVGVTIADDKQGKTSMMKRVANGVREFRKLEVASSPQQMIHILVETQKEVSKIEFSDSKKDEDAEAGITEKSNAITMNADTLVSLLIMVVIRSQVRHLQARLAYMRDFVFIDDVEKGEMGYALSTFEAVLSYLATDSAGLKRASRTNKRLWQATRRGFPLEVKMILEPNSHQEQPVLGIDIQGSDNHDTQDTGTRRLSVASTELGTLSEPSSLAHVFPFQRRQSSPDLPIRKSKRVSMDLRSLSNASDSSLRSRSNTLDSMTSGISGDVSIGTLAQTQDAEGDSVLMMAVQSSQAEVLEYLLSLEEYFPLKMVLDDANSEGTTLLSAAVQLGHGKTIHILLSIILHERDEKVINAYFCKADSRGRTMAHYLFNAPDLIHRLGERLPWRQKDKNGQTPLLALSRSYDHPNYLEMVFDAMQFATLEQGDGELLHIDNHVDSKGNTLLHAVNEPSLAARILRHCDSSPNAANDKRFTPLMVASKYGRLDIIRVLFSDRRVDIAARELRGMTAVELAKDDEVRNRIDDMVLVSHVPAADGRVTAVVRSFFVEDSSIRLIIKTATRNDNGMISVTTCRRSLTDFEDLARWLSTEHPASWLPSTFNFRHPFQIPSRPSRAALQDIQVRLDRFLKTMLAHSTFSTHELLWEFILFPEIQPEMMAERSRKKVELRAENIKEEYEPVEDVRDVELFVGHARDALRGVNQGTKSLIRKVSNARNAVSDFSTAFSLCNQSFSALSFLPSEHVTALMHFSSTLVVSFSDPFLIFHYDLLAVSSTNLAILSSLSRPHTLISSLQNLHDTLSKHTSSLRRSDRWPLGLLDNTRKSIHAEAQARVDRTKEQIRQMGCELSYTQRTVAGELAGWQEGHVRMGRRAVGALAKAMVIRERERLEDMRRAVRALGLRVGGK
ncbi:MAG: hypothetical protein LQ351_005014 [Letrouitia transgressa]|nr:MAG: hypothetical protein LQ351_005014 [Letrouitia transgressa]